MDRHEKIKEWIGTMSYYNAAEGSSYTREGSARNKFKDDMAEEVKTWDITEEEFIDMYNKHNRQLTSYSCFVYPLSVRKAFKETE